MNLAKEYVDVLTKVIPGEDIDNIPVVENADRGIRFKVTPNCSWRCSFCHKEGGWSSLQVVKWDDEATSVFGRLFNSGYREVHLTGGEPTLNRNLPEIIENLKRIGFTVKMTSILGGTQQSIAEIVDAGLDEVNISMHMDFGDVDLASQTVPDHIAIAIAGVQIDVGIARAKKQIIRLLNNLELLKEKKVGLKGNTVISSVDDIPRALSIYRYAIANGIKLRFLSNITPDVLEESYRARFELVRQLGGKPVKIKFNKGTSSISIDCVDPEGNEFGVKMLADVFLGTLCDGCALKNTNQCSEKYYGLRLENLIDPTRVHTGYFVRLCLHRTDAGILLPIEEFFESEYFRQIVEQCL